MSQWRGTRRDFGKAVAVGAAAFAAATRPSRGQDRSASLDEQFFVRPEELTLRCLQAPGHRTLSFARYEGEPEAWRKACREKLTELLGFARP
ncbi:MAG: hypothetical protein ACE5I3_14010, partial [Phycisphaerae bacterium]